MFWLLFLPLISCSIDPELINKESTMSSKMLAPITLRPDQREWLAEEKERTGESFATIVRGLLQEKVYQSNKAKAKAEKARAAQGRGDL
jgi:hypothetical protein